MRMDDMRQVVATNLRKLRHAKGLSQEALAFESGVDRSYISQLETGVYSASVTMLGKLAAALDVEPGRLLQPARPNAKKRS